jgi:NTP pyrophosphatase (non-canonical NTP hydrolase)
MVPQKIALIHSEVSEAFEGYRRDLMDDHLPSRKSIEVELADAVIRIFDLAGALKLDLGGAYVDKRAYNKTRLDHKRESRVAPNGKRF